MGSTTLPSAQGVLGNVVLTVPSRDKGLHHLTPGEKAKIHREKHLQGPCSSEILKRLKKEKISNTFLPLVYRLHFKISKCKLGKLFNRFLGNKCGSPDKIW